MMKVLVPQTMTIGKLNFKESGIGHKLSTTLCKYKAENKVKLENLHKIGM